MEVCFISRCLGTTSVFNFRLLGNGGIRPNTHSILATLLLCTIRTMLYRTCDKEWRDSLAGTYSVHIVVCL
jgi:hypothetical protein